MKDAIKNAREKLGMTQTELAKIMNVSQSAVSHWERGLSSPPSRQIPMLADVLKTTVSQLFDRNS